MKREICDSRQQLVNDNGGGLVTLFINEQEVMVTERRYVGEGESEKVEVTKYAYDMVEVLVDGVATDEKVLQAVKDRTKEAIDIYDASSEVNSFTIGNKELWIDRTTRTALMRRFEVEKLAEVTTTTLWYGNDSFTLPVEQAVAMINAIELYACQCYDVTAAHKVAVDELTDIEEAYNYDYRTGYPEKLSFDL